MTRVNDQSVASRGMGKASARDGTKPIYTEHTLVENYKDQRNVDGVAKLYSEMVGFPNLASDPAVQEQAKAAVLSSLKDTFSTFQYLRNKWLICYRLYRGETLAAAAYGRQKLHSPTPFKIVETIHPRIMRTVFGSQRWFQLYGKNEEHDQAAMAQEILCRDQLRVCDYRKKASRFVRDGLIYGTAIQKTYWKQELADRAYRVARREPDDKIPGATKVKLSEVKREEMIFDGNDILPISIFDFYAPPAASSIEEAEWCCDRQLWPDYRVKQMVELGHWKNTEALEGNTGDNDYSYEDPFKQRKAYAYGLFDPRGGKQTATIPHYEVVDWWGPLVIKKENGQYITKMCNVVMIQPRSNAIIARVTVNPFWHGKKPYQVWRPIELQDELFGIGAIEPIARLSMEKDTKRSLLMSATQLEGNPMLVVSDQANIPPGQLVAQPGLIIRVPGNPNEAVMPIALPQVSDAPLKAENILEAEMREVSGVTSPVIGAQDPLSSSAKTATQYNSELNEANMRLSGAMENLDNEVTVSMLEQMCWNNMQFQSSEKVIRDIGPMGVRFRDRWTIRPEDLIGRFIVQPLSGFKLLTKQTQIQQLVNLFDRAPQINQLYGPNAVKMPKLYAYILEQGFDIRNVDEFIGLPPEETRLLTAIEEQELWYHGNVPPRRPDDNDLRHAQSHLMEIKSERFGMLEEGDPATASLARAHIADHMRKLALLAEQQEKMMMDMAQAAAMQGIMQGDSSMSPDGGPSNAAEGGPTNTQEPGSPKLRTNEQTDSSRNGNDMGGSDMKSNAMAGAPNAGAI
jgi:hypothetical protein